MKISISTRMVLLVIALGFLTFSPTKAFASICKKQWSEDDSVRIRTERLLRFCGEYLPTGTDPRMVPMTVEVRNGILYRHIHFEYIALNQVSANKFVYDDGSGRSLEFISDKKGSVKEVTVARTDGEFKLKRNPLSKPVQIADVEYGLPEEIGMLMKSYADYGKFNGTVLVARKGEVIYKEAFGKANFEWGVPNQVATKYRLASVSKQFTAMLILQLVHQRKLSLQIPIAYYLPDYPQEQGKKITIHHLLNHSSGIPNFTSLPDYEGRMMTKHYSPEALVKEFSSLPLEFEPGTKFSYSNSGYVLLGYLIEKITGKSYEENLQENIFKPLDMKNSGYDHSEEVLDRRANGYEKKGGKFVNAGYIDMSVPYAAGAIYSTVEDLFLWDQALLVHKVLHPSTQELMFKNYFEGKGFGYGYGWGIGAYNSLRENKTRTLLEHSGGINGFNSIISRIPEDNLLVVLLSNVSSPYLSEINYAIRAICYNQPYDLPKRSFALTLGERIQADGLKTTAYQIEEMKKSGQYHLHEGEINDLGYTLLNEKKYEEAILVFKQNVQFFPNSGNCYDSLGEAYMKSGNKEQAILNYKKAIELDPNNENAKKILADLMK